MPGAARSLTARINTKRLFSQMADSDSDSDSSEAAIGTTYSPQHRFRPGTEEAAIPLSSMSNHSADANSAQRYFGDGIDLRRPVISMTNNIVDLTGEDDDVAPPARPVSATQELSRVGNNVIEVMSDDDESLSGWIPQGSERRRSAQQTRTSFSEEPSTRYQSMPRRTHGELRPVNVADQPIDLTDDDVIIVDERRRRPRESNTSNLPTYSDPDFRSVIVRQTNRIRGIGEAHTHLTTRVDHSIRRYPVSSTFPAQTLTLTDLPGLMDYALPAFEIGSSGFLSRQRHPSPAYVPPPSPGEGFTRNPEEDEEVVCPNCGDELLVSSGDVKQQLWVAKQCGHVSIDRYK
ncbi:hypothetical protein K470DRAFT_258306 [Piedraia hortae CBS 480.64]|uniref:Uncharacterized protein n=1 Tax=Piedraia hortae CBS 480.64 TaxID=1314780 RepID=A0A6A7BXY7_9PEZI|nr:hypothetical protein K470DRAFT_258306 [Piedraia hortae CBS 480.64]